MHVSCFCPWQGQDIDHGIVNDNHTNDNNDNKHNNDSNVNNNSGNKQVIQVT